MGSLAGVRVVEIGTSVAVPYGCQILADFGAEVIKVERLGGGDDARAWAPVIKGVSVTFLALNRSKKSVVVNYKDEQGAEVLEKLIASADVLVQNLRPGALAAAGFTWERMREINPRLIYAEMTGYGRTGPRSEQPAYDAMLQAYSGVVAMTGADDGPPARVPLSIMDLGTGMWIALGVFDALRRRDQTGEGVHLEASLLQTALSWVGPALMNVAAGDPVPKRLGSGFGGNVPNGAFPASDGYVFLSVGNNESFYRLLKAIEAPELKYAPEFADNVTRVANRAVVNARLGEATSRFTMDELLERLDRAQVPHSAVNTLDKVLVDPQVQAIGQLEQLDHPQMGPFTIVNTPLTFDGEYLAHRGAPPGLGADTSAVLSDIGVTPEQLEALVQAGIVEAAKTSTDTDTDTQGDAR
ncbi:MULTISPECIES: CaiB/BaiF CoA-transferase family protein [unclassified Salinibacterium]|uniref:CaiB/BaiF CoA transferase family protein n=1 Tax=unclassified Salinibacterium TaxID=2632331 RepID=UPI001F10790C|nr:MULTISPECIES: CoA transferase [unclassified Salinibacterium]